MRHYMYEPGSPDKAKQHKEIGRYLQSLDKSHKYVIEIKQHRDGRSLSQNNLYWMWLTVIVNETGQGTGDKKSDCDKLHQKYRRKFLKQEEITEDGEVQYEILSTADLNTLEFTVYLNRIRQDVLDEFNIDLPDPKSVTYADWMKIDTDYEKIFSGL